ncbi:MAG: hypothetical protein BHW02_03295 [Clostridium sp. 28_12]|nr:MAG: hypothetical protein BHW02_03295 [Clostridium sp. 28_12]
MNRRKVTTLMSLVVSLVVFISLLAFSANTVSASDLSRNENIISDLKLENNISSPYIDSEGKSLSPENAQKVEELLASLKKIEGFAVFANELSQTNLIEGNICVNKAIPHTNIVLSRVYEVEPNDYSYIGDTTSPIQITGNSDFDLAPINVGPNIKVEQPNKNQTIINGGYSTNILATELTDEEYINATSLINSVLDNLASIGDAIKYEADTSFYEDQTDSFSSINKLLKNNVAKNGDVVCINVDYTQLINNEGSFGYLINNNSGTRIVVNVITDNSPTINIQKGFTTNTNVSTEFNQLSPYIIWNFGSYAGSINISEEMLGIIVAPKAQVFQASGNLNGEIVASIAGSNGEIHQVSVTPDIPTSEAVEPSQTPEAVEPSQTPEAVEPSITPTPLEPISTKSTESTQIPSEVIKKTKMVDTGDKTNIKKLLEIFGAAGLTLIIAAFLSYSNKKK